MYVIIKNIYHPPQLDSCAKGYEPFFNIIIICCPIHEITFLLFVCKDINCI
jgi:hypothetical protein